MAGITARCVYFKLCSVCSCVRLSDLDVWPISCIGTVGVCVQAGSVDVWLRLGAEPPQVVSDVEQLSVDAVLYTLAVQVHSEAGAGEHYRRVVLKALQEVH